MTFRASGATKVLAPTEGTNNCAGINEENGDDNECDYNDLAGLCHAADARLANGTKKLLNSVLLCRIVFCGPWYGDHSIFFSDTPFRPYSQRPIDEPRRTINNPSND